MRRRLLVPLMLALVVCMGSECSSSSSNGSAANGASVRTANTDDPPPVIEIPVPEPSAMLVFGLGLVIAGAAVRRKRR